MNESKESLEYEDAAAAERRRYREPAELRVEWESQWEKALAAWSRFTKLAPPRWCLTAADEKNQQLSESFAMIRLLDHAVVISLRQVAELGLQRFGAEILAHEVGHHVLAPGDLRDNARLMLRIRAALPTREKFAGMIANLYTDLLINDRLQRSAQLDMSGVYRVLRQKAAMPLWQLYMRIYEILWNLPPDTLVDPVKDERIQVDAMLGARLVRVYGKDWLAGAGRFGALCLPYLLEIPEVRTLVMQLPPWLDASEAGEGGEVPDGLVEVEEGELDGAIHPSEDEELSGVASERQKKSAPRAGGAATVGGVKNPVRTPEAYREVMASLGVKVTKKDLVIRYYRELAARYLIRFPQREVPQAMDPIPEGTDVWEPGSPVVDIDWNGTLARGPYVIPGVTTQRRLEGMSPGTSRERMPLDLYIGIDCSGSMSNPAMQLSYPVLAATVITVSALRVGAKVMACLSGEPGKHTETDGFCRRERDVMAVLTDYLGTGYAFGIGRLKETFLDGAKPDRPVHLLVVSDYDIFHMLGEFKNGWDVARDAVARAGGGGTFLLEVEPKRCAAEIARLKSIGWDVYTVKDQAELVAFARAFSRANYETRKEERRHP